MTFVPPAHLSVMLFGSLGLLALCSPFFTAQITCDSVDLVATGSIASVLQRRRGRPRKFPDPSRAVTLTLPEAVLEKLTTIDRDVSRAIVKLSATQIPAVVSPKPADLAVFGRRAVITVRPTSALVKLEGVELIPLPDGRALVSFEQPKTVAELQLTLHDALEDATLSRADREVVHEIVELLNEARRSREVELTPRNIVVLQYARSPRRTAAQRGATAGRKNGNGRR